MKQTKAILHKLRFLIVLIFFLSFLPLKALAEPQPVLPGGRFGFAYFNLNGSTTEATPEGYVQYFAGAKQNPSAFTGLINRGKDIRKLNPNGVYVKHINVRMLDRNQRSTQIEGRPDYDYIHTNHPEWILKDAAGNPVTLYLPTEEALDFGNDAYLDWLFNTWMPTQFLDATDRDPNVIAWFQHDNGAFGGMSINCTPGDTVCARYTASEGVMSAWENMLTKFKERWPNKRMIISTGVSPYSGMDQQLAVLKRGLGKSHGYYGEALTNDLVYWSGAPNSGKRTALLTTMQLASWLADNNKVFMPILGQSGGPPNQTQINYGYAFFNLMRKGDWQFFSILTKSGDSWVPRTYPEMFLSLGNPLENATETSAYVYRRNFEHAIAYMNISDSTVTVNLPSGTTYRNSLGQALLSTLTLPSFSGLTVYKDSSSSTTPAPSLSLSPTPSPSGTLKGDLNNDRIVNSLDWSIMNSRWFSSDSTADLNSDGIVNSLDFSIMNGNWLKSV